MIDLRGTSPWARVITTTVVFLVAAGAALLTMRLVPSVREDVGVGTIGVDSRLGSGVTVVSVPPLGSVQAATHHFPLTIRVEVEAIEPTALGDHLISASGREQLRRRAERAIEDAAKRLAMRLAIAGLIVGGVVGAVLPRRGWLHVLGGAGGGLVAVVLALGLTAATYDIRAFAEPKFTGTLTRAPEIITAVQRHIGSLSEIRSRYGIIGRRLADLLATVARPLPSLGRNSVTILHVSDIHSNPLGAEVARNLAQAFPVDAVIDTGDITSFGNPIEGQIGKLLAGMKVPYIYVPGNHDSAHNRRVIGQLKNVRLLDRGVTNIDEVKILGIGDPTFTANHRLSTDDANEIKRIKAPQVAARVQNTEPDVLAVHDRRLAVRTYGLVPVVVSGHTHEQYMRVQNGTVVLTVGSTGATGLGNFAVQSSKDYEAEVLYFNSHQLVALDYVRLKGLDGAFEVERHTFGSGKQRAAP